MEVELTDSIIDLQRSYGRLDDPACGAAVLFVGRVRDHNDGRAVSYIRYTAHKSMVLAEGERILREAAQKFGLRKSLIVHYVGDLGVGGISVVVGAATPHRGVSFAATSWIMEEVKRRLPVWKEEYYVEGGHAWPQNMP
ncbi:MAG: molybdopterin-converting factor chain 2 [Deltaproteobacteria bacterium CG11_big_fil_rev_8_21_14_0_20_47_16]|nr:MAG: molybdopterin-converting factor chain 2 [Deltaproteobacteria bacterium CG11_big_fil_rev_8_21_14_0_20_47_16]